jgi:hypothetical protein
MNITQRLTTLATSSGLAGLLVLETLLTAVAQAAPATPSTATDGTAIPSALVGRLGSIQADGGEITKVVHADYTPSSKAATGNSALMPQAAALPSGCGLWVLVYKSGSSMRSESVTYCSSVMAYGYMYGGIARKRWWGWQELNAGEAETHWEKSFELNVSTYCANEGTYDYMGSTEGELEIYGRWYSASAWDWDLGVKC